MQEHEEHGTRGTLYTIMMVNQVDQPAELTTKTSSFRCRPGDFHTWWRESLWRTKSCSQGMARLRLASVRMLAKFVWEGIQVIDCENCMSAWRVYFLDYSAWISYMMHAMAYWVYMPWCVDKMPVPSLHTSCPPLNFAFSAMCALVHQYCIRDTVLIYC